MHTLIIRGAMITCFAITGLFGSAATVQFDGMGMEVQTNSAEARWNQKENCPWVQDEPGTPDPSPLGGKCRFG